MELVVSTISINNMLAFAETKGLKPKDLCVACHINYDDLENPTIAIPLQQTNLLWELIEYKTKDPHIGLHLGEFYKLNALGLVGMILQNSADVISALEKACEYANLLSNTLQLKITLLDNSLRIDFMVSEHCKAHSKKAAQYATDAAMVFAQTEIKALTGEKVYPIRAGFAYKENQTNEYNRIFNCALSFGCVDAFLEYPVALAHKKIKLSDFELLVLLEKEAQKRLKNVGLKSYSNKIESLIISQLDGSYPTIQTIAQILNTTPRTIQRQLKKEDLTYNNIVKKVKKEMVVMYMQNDLSISQISYLMGYSDVGSFTNAFKNWFGTTPSSYQNKI
jgi:AraC-like DNA-binding protein